TLRAVKQFQESRGIKPHGIIDAQTVQYLDSSNYVEQNNFEQQQVMTLARAINGEARGESFRGQVGVGAVILNRVQNSNFANSIREVIYQQGQFSAVSDGQVNLPPTDSSIQAAKAALLGYDPTGDALYFYNPEVATKLEWISSRPKIVKIDNHIFAD
ncbi:MAG: cell wall hydrolase, partial [Bacillota bacterium]